MPVIYNPLGQWNYRLYALFLTFPSLESKCKRALYSLVINAIYIISLIYFYVVSLYSL